MSSEALLLRLLRSRRVVQARGDSLVRGIGLAWAACHAADLAGPIQEQVVRFAGEAGGLHQLLALGAMCCAAMLAGERDSAAVSAATSNVLPALLTASQRPGSRDTQLTALVDEVAPLLAEGFASQTGAVAGPLLRSVSSASAAVRGPGGKVLRLVAAAAFDCALTVLEDSADAAAVAAVVQDCLRELPQLRGSWVAAAATATQALRSRRQPPAAAPAAAVSTAVAPQAAAAPPASADAEVGGGDREEHAQLVRTHGVPVPLSGLPETAALLDISQNPEMAVQAARRQRDAAVGHLNSLAGRLHDMTAFVLQECLTGGTTADEGDEEKWGEVWRLRHGTPPPHLPAIFTVQGGNEVLFVLRQMVQLPFATGIRPSLVACVSSLLAAPIPLPRAWVVDVLRDILSAASDPDEHLTQEVYTALSTAAMWRVPLADVLSLCLDTLQGDTTPLTGPELPSIMPVATPGGGAPSDGAVVEHVRLPGARVLAAQSPVRLQRAVLWMGQAAAFLRPAGPSARDEVQRMELARIRGEVTAQTTLQPACMTRHAWLYLGHALGALLDHRSLLVRDAAGVALGSVLDLVGHSTALQTLMARVDLLKAGKMVAAWQAAARRGSARQRASAASARTDASRGRRKRTGAKRSVRSAEGLGGKAIAPPASPPRVPASLTPATLDSLRSRGGVPALPGSQDGCFAGQDSQAPDLSVAPALVSCAGAWRAVGVPLGAAVFTPAPCAPLRALAERAIALHLLGKEEAAVASGNEEDVAEVVADAGNALNEAQHMQAYKLSLVCLLLLKRHARVMVRIHMFEALPPELQGLLKRYNIPSKAASSFFASHVRALRRSTLEELTPQAFLSTLPAAWGMQSVRGNLVAFFREHYMSILEAAGDPLPPMSPGGPTPAPPPAPQAETTGSAAPASPFVLGLKSSGHFLPSNVPASFLQEALSRDGSEPVPPLDALRLILHWARAQADTSQPPLGTTEGELRQLLANCIDVGAIAPPDLLASCELNPSVFGLLDAGQVLRHVLEAQA